MVAAFMDVLEQAVKVLRAFCAFFAINAVSIALFPFWIFAWRDILTWQLAGLDTLLAAGT